MYDYLDKMGLKAVLAAIKEKIPTSLPAKGGNADYATNAGNADTVDNLHIKTATVSAGTDEYGNIILWDVSANIIPFFAYASNISNIICRPFIGNSRKSWMLAIDNSSTHQPIKNSSSVAFIIYYFEINS